MFGCTPPGKYKVHKIDLLLCGDTKLSENAIELISSKQEGDSCFILISGEILYGKESKAKYGLDKFRGKFESKKNDVTKSLEKLSFPRPDSLFNKEYVNKNITEDIYDPIVIFSDKNKKHNLEIEGYGYRIFNEVKDFIDFRDSLFISKENGYYLLVIYNPPSCVNKDTFPDGISLNKTSLSLENIGSTERLKAYVYPDSIFEKNKNVKWQSGDEKIAKVDSNGVVTAVANSGNVIILANTLNGLSATCNVTIGKVVTGITLDKTSATISKGNTQRFKYTIIPNDAANKSVVWQSDKTAIATVDSTGNVKALAEGTATITVTTVDGGKTATCIVKITPTPPPLEKITYSFGTYKGGKKYSNSVTRKYYPEGEGTMVYTKRLRIARQDDKEHYSEAGYSLVGTWINGDISNGALKDHNGKVIEYILAGARNTVYDLENDNR